jgi:hypothetical protein
MRPHIDLRSGIEVLFSRFASSVRRISTEANDQSVSQSCPYHRFNADRAASLGRKPRVKRHKRQNSMNYETNASLTWNLRLRRSRCQQEARRRSRSTVLMSSSSTRLHRHPHNNNLTRIVYRMCFDKHCAEKSHRCCAVQISHASLFCPYKGAVSRRACRSPNHSTHVVDTKSSAGVSTGKDPQILHSSCLSPQKSAHAPWTFRVPNDIPVIVDCASLARCISR